MNTEFNWFEMEVRVRSHAIWEREGCKDGCSEEHWMRGQRRRGPVSCCAGGHGRAFCTSTSHDFGAADQAGGKTCVSWAGGPDTRHSVMSR